MTKAKLRKPAQRNDAVKGGATTASCVCLAGKPLHSAGSAAPRPLSATSASLFPASGHFTIYKVDGGVFRAGNGPRLVLALWSLLTNAACDTTRLPADWPDLFAGLPERPAAIYSPAFHGSSSDDKLARLSLHSSSACDACELYERPDNWGNQIALQLTTNRFMPGRFSIVEHISTTVDLQAEARIIRTRAGLSTVKYPATIGYITLDEVPEQTGEWFSGKKLTGTVHVGFVKDPVVQSECSRSFDRAGTALFQECRCEHSSGATSTCTPATDQDTCCASDGAVEYTHDAVFSAEPCSALCEYLSSDLAGLCAELEPQSDAGGSGCSSSCESNDWPRVILGIVDPHDAGQEHLAVHGARVIDATGTSWPGVAGGCPSANGYVCSYAWSTSPSDKSIKLEIELDDGQAFSTDVALAPHNYCARNIAYVQFDLTQPPSFDTTRYLSPCTVSGDKE